MGVKSHTPGPWRLVRERRQQGWVIQGPPFAPQRKNGPGVALATVAFAADAKLVEKAPELLALAEDVAEADCAEVIPGEPGCGECLQCRARALLGERS